MKKYTQIINLAGIFLITYLREIPLHFQMQWFVEVTCIETLPRSWLLAQLHIPACEHSRVNLRILFSLLLSTANILILHNVLITGSTFWWISPKLTVSENRYLEKLVNAIIPLRHDWKAVFLCLSFAISLLIRIALLSLSVFYTHDTL